MGWLVLAQEREERKSPREKEEERSEIESLFFYSNSFQILFQIVFKFFCKLLNNHSLQK
jgi:hypothetical protein